MVQRLRIGVLELVLGILALTAMAVESGEQTVFNDINHWTVQISKSWDVLGPFPIHAREQHFLSPSFPIDLTSPFQVDLNKTWSSSYADGGEVQWGTAHSDDDGKLNVFFPDIRWEALRATEGWSALQHHSVLRTTVTLYPPSANSQSPQAPPRLRVNLLQGSFFALLPSANAFPDEFIPEWHAGNIYAMERSLPESVALPVAPSASHPTKYDLVVSGDYEIRLFGDPRHIDSDIPVLKVSLTVDVEQPVETIIWESSYDVSCDFIDGYAFGGALGVGVRSVHGWWTVEQVVLLSENTDITLELLHPVHIAPTQTRVVPIQIAQTQPFDGSKLSLNLLVSSATSTTALSVHIPLTHHHRWTESTFAPLKGSYFYASSTPTSFLTIPPTGPNAGDLFPPILALHGAGLDIFSQPSWAASLPRQKHSWILVPVGRTSWGLDWHGPSVGDTWASLAALENILNSRGEWRPWKIQNRTRVVVMGHSNGGQGAWYLASRYPDRVVAVVPAAGYLKSQLYVAWNHARSGHFIDPALRAVLESSLTPDDNDLFLSNLADMPVLAIHGGSDDNVPTWHSREAVSVIKTWRADANATFQEDPGQPHWYPSVLASPSVQAFLDSVISTDAVKHLAPLPKSFTLTVVNPFDSGSMHGWTIDRPRIPGRLSRLHVKYRDGAVYVQTTNVERFSTASHSFPLGSLLFVDYGPALSDVPYDGRIHVELRDTLQWEVTSADDFSAHRAPPIRMASILASSKSLVMVVPVKEPSRTLSAALRLSHALDVYHKLSVEIIDDSEALARVQSVSLEGNIISFAGPDTPFFTWCLEQRLTQFEVGSGLYFRGRPVDGKSRATLFMHPHPMETTDKLLFLYSSDDAGLERALRLFPLRTGITVPDWIIVGERADSVGAAGVEGAGVWGRNWGWNEAVSWFG